MTPEQKCLLEIRDELGPHVYFWNGEISLSNFYAMAVAVMETLTQHDQRYGWFGV